MGLKIEKNSDVYNQTIAALNKVNQAYKAIVYSRNESSDTFKTVWEKAKAEIVVDKKFKAKEQKSRSTNNPIWNKYFEQWDKYSQARDSLINLYNVSKSVEILENPEYKELTELCVSTFNLVIASFEEFKKTWNATYSSEQQEKREADADFKASWSESKKALIEINKAVKQEKMVLKKAIEVGIKTAKAIGREEKAQEISKEALKVFTEIKKALELF